jgi:hypothetical protein
MTVIGVRPFTGNHAGRGIGRNDVRLGCFGDVGHGPNLGTPEQLQKKDGDKVLKKLRCSTN